MDDVRAEYSGPARILGISNREIKGDGGRWWEIAPSSGHVRKVGG